MAILALLATTSAAGCGPTGTPSPVSAVSTTGVPTPPPTDTPAAAAPGPLMTTLTLWLPVELDPYGEAPESQLLAQRLSDFGSSRADLQVRVIVKRVEGRGGLLDFMRTASLAAPSVLPDLVIWDTTSMRAATQRGLLQPMDELLPPSLMEDRFSFASALGEVDSQTMGVVMAAELQHLAYRPQLVQTSTFSWTGIISSATTLAFPASGTEGAVNDFTLAQYLTAGGRLTNAEGNPQLNEGPLAEVMKFYQRGVGTGSISPTVVLSLANTDQCWEILQGWQAGAAVVDSRRFWTERTEDILPAPLPGADGAGASMADGWVLSLVTSDPDRQMAAMLLVEWLLVPEHNGPWTQSGGYLPATLGALREWVIEEEERALLRELLDGAIPLPDSAARSAVAPALQTAVEAVLEGRRDPVNAAADAARSIAP